MKRPPRETLVPWGVVLAAALGIIGIVAYSRAQTGPFAANLLIGLPLLAAVAAVLILRRTPKAREAREWTTVLVVTAIVYGVLASFSVREGTLALTYLVQTGFTIGIFAILALGLSIQMGYAGLLNFGHVAFMGIGAYVIAIWTTRFAAPIAERLQGGGPGAILMAILAAILAGLVVYVPLLVVAQRFRTLAARWRFAIAILPALAVALLVVNTVLPLDARGAMGMAILLGAILALLIAGLAGVALGAASLRLREDYLAIVTLGTAEIFRIWITNQRGLTNGSLGILLSTGAHQMPITAWARTQEGYRQFVRDIGMGGNYALLTSAIVVLLLAALAFLILENLARSPWGRVLKSIREDEDVASALGKNTLLYKLQVLFIGSVLAAAAGILFTWNKTNVYPTDFLPIITFYTIAILVLGGVGNHKGAILGSLIIWGIFEFAGSMNNAFRVPCRAGEANWFASIFCDFAGPKQQILIGAVLILVIMFRPQGAVGNREELAHAK